MLGIGVDLRIWDSRAAHFPWLAKLAKDFRGVKPPRYPDRLEAICNAIAFQQLSIVAAASIMRRFAERLSDPIERDGVRVYPFPAAESIFRATEARLRGAGLSRQKAQYLRGVAEAVTSRTVTATIIESLPTDRAS